MPSNDHVVLQYFRRLTRNTTYISNASKDLSTFTQVGDFTFALHTV
jgi:hypothetical protein